MDAAPCDDSCQGIKKFIFLDNNERFCLSHLERYHENLEYTYLCEIIRYRIDESPTNEILISFGSNVENIISLIRKRINQDIDLFPIIDGENQDTDIVTYKKDRIIYFLSENRARIKITLNSKSLLYDIKLYKSLSDLLPKFAKRNNIPVEILEINDQRNHFIYELNDLQVNLKYTNYPTIVTVLFAEINKIPQNQNKISIIFQILLNSCNEVNQIRALKSILFKLSALQNQDILCLNRLENILQLTILRENDENLSKKYLHFKETLFDFLSRPLNYRLIMSLEFINEYGDKEQISKMLLDYIYDLYVDVFKYLSYSHGTIKKIFLNAELINLVESIIFSPPSLEVINLLHYEIPLNKKDYIRQIFSN